MASSRKPRSASPARPDGLAKAVEAFLREVPVAGKSLVLGLSGGLDSLVLLHVLAELAPRLGFRLRAVHVHHGLSPRASEWARHCRRLCKALDVPLTVRRVK